MTADAYRAFLARLEADRARHLEAARWAEEPELLIAASSMASALLHAIAVAVHEFEGPEAAQNYVRRAVGGSGLERSAATPPPA